MVRAQHLFPTQNCTLEHFLRLFRLGPSHSTEAQGFQWCSEPELSQTARPSRSRSAPAGRTSPPAPPCPGPYTGSRVADGQKRRRVVGAQRLLVAGQRPQVELLRQRQLALISIQIPQVADDHQRRRVVEAQRLLVAGQRPQVEL